MERKTKAIARHKGILNYLTKEWDISSEEDAESDKNKLKIYEVNSKAWYLLIISLAYIPFGLVMQCDNNAHETWKALIEKYEVSGEKQEGLNEVINRCNNYRIKDKNKDPDIWFNEKFNLNLKVKKIKAKYEKDEDDLKAHLFDILPEYYKPARVSCNSSISKMTFKDPKKEIRWFWKTKLNLNKKQEKPEPEDKVTALNYGENKQ